MNREDVNYINAHAASTPAGDMNEYESIIRCFGDNPVVIKHIHFLPNILAINLLMSMLNLISYCLLQLKINSTKSMTGHLLGAAGAVEAVATIKVILYTMYLPRICVACKRVNLIYYCGKVLKIFYNFF